MYWPRETSAESVPDGLVFLAVCAEEVFEKTAKTRRTTTDSVDCRTNRADELAACKFRVFMLKPFLFFSPLWMRPQASRWEPPIIMREKGALRNTKQRDSRCGMLRCMRVNVRYLGMLRELAGRDGEPFELPDGSPLGELYTALQKRIPELEQFHQAIALAVNYEYSASDTRLHEGDEVALIPPVSGGAPDGTVGNALASAPTTEHAALVRQPIDGAAIAAAIRQPADGAVVVFDGIVRNQTRGRRTLFLDYTAYEPMALQRMEQLAQQALASYAVRAVSLVHRLGRLGIGETSVFIAVASAHRAAAFDASRWLIDTLKKTVPIWKKEYFEDGAVWADGEPFPPEVPLARQSSDTGV